MQRINLRLRDQEEFQKAWALRFAQGNFFLSVSLPLHSEFELRFQVGGQECGLSLRAKVMQVLEGPAGEPQGIFAEFSHFQDCKEMLAKAVEEIVTGQNQGMIDFEAYRHVNSGLSHQLILEPLVQPKSTPPWEGKARNEEQEKASCLYEAACLLAKAKEEPAALAALRLAIKLEPKNTQYLEKLRQLQKRQMINRSLAQVEKHTRQRSKSSDGWLG